MALPLLTQHLVKTKLLAYCERKIPAHARHQVRLSYEIDTHKVTLNEEREAFSQPGTWITIPIAQFRFVESTGLWTLYCANLTKRDAWRIYPEAKPTKDFEALLSKLDTDQMGVFWG
jgi:hypothetical protein